MPVGIGECRWSAGGASGGLLRPASGGTVGFAAQLVDDVLDRLAHAHEGEPGLCGDHDVGDVAVSDGARFDHRDVGRVDEDVAVGVVGCPRFAEDAALRLAAYPQPGRLVPPLSTRPPGRGGANRTHLRGTRNLQGPAGAKSLLEVARDPRRARRRPGRGACGFRPVRIGRIGRAAAESGDFRPRGDPETAALSDFVALERAPGRLRARLGAMVRCRSMTLAPIEAARWLGWLGSAAGTNEVVRLAVEES